MIELFLDDLSKGGKESLVVANRSGRSAYRLLGCVRSMTPSRDLLLRTLRFLSCFLVWNWSSFGKFLDLSARVVETSSELPLT